MTLAERIESLDPRERRLLGLLGGAIVVFVGLMAFMGVSSVLGDKAEANQALRDALAELDLEAPAVLGKRAEREALAARYAAALPALPGFLSHAGQEVDLEIPQIKESSPVARGKNYEERSTSVSLRGVGLRPLVLFMEKVSGSPQPISISKLNIRKRGAAADVYDVQMTVSAFHRTGAKAAPEPAEETP